ncbi:hypothetical protein D3C78_1520280 [compost metagenome]
MEKFVDNKRNLATAYNTFFQTQDISFVTELTEAKANYWLNALLFSNRDERDAFLTYSNENGVMTRPIWELMNRLEMFKDCQTDALTNSIWIADRLVNIPSGFRV